MHYLIVSFSHKNTDIKTREQLAINSESKRERLLREANSLSYINESIILSTCNRVEIILSTSEIMKSKEHIFNILHTYSEISKDELEGRADIFEDSGAVHHIFSVASSLDSLVVGETQIAGQLKEAFQFSYSRGFCSQKLSRVMHYAFKCAAEVRNQTDISKNPVSVSSTAVAKAKEIFKGELGGYSALVIGAGEMSILTIKHLVNSGCNVILINRDIERAKEIAKEVGSLVSVEPISKLAELINRYRLLFSATGAPHTVITEDMIEARTFSRYWFDIAVPVDIDYTDKFEDIHIYRVDDLQDIVNRNLALREEQAKVAYSIIGRYTSEFFHWLQSLAVEPLIKDIRLRVEDIKSESVDRAVKKGFIPKEYENSLELILNTAFNKFLHSQTKKLRSISKEPVADSIVESVKFLFELDSESKLIDNYKCEKLEK